MQFICLIIQYIKFLHHILVALFITGLVAMRFICLIIQNIHLHHHYFFFSCLVYSRILIRSLQSILICCEVFCALLLLKNKWSHNPSFY